MVRANRTRIDFLARFQKLIEDYESGEINIEIFFEQLLELAGKLQEEEKRATSEQLTEEELALFDILTKPRMELTDRDIAQAKKTARDLLDTLEREKLVLDWRKRQQSRAAVKVAIEQGLDQGLTAVYTPELFRVKAEAVFQHMYESYYGAGTSVYSRMAAAASQ